MNQTINDSPACKVCGGVEGYDRIFDQLDECRTCGFITFRDFDEQVLLDIYNDDYFAGNEYPDYLGQQDQPSMQGEGSDAESTLAGPVMAINGHRGTGAGDRDAV